MFSQTLQGAVLSMTSNVLAQAVASYNDSVSIRSDLWVSRTCTDDSAAQTPFSLAIAPVLKFAMFSIISTPPNIIWQTFLEDHFPTNVPSTAQKGADEKPITPSKTQISKVNVLIKFLLDQTIGAVVNTLMFLAYMAYVNASQQGKQDAWSAVAKDCSDKTWPMMKDGYKFWPAISLISFLWVPVDKRVLFGSMVGVVWGIYLSLAANAWGLGL
jgi:hypothetical protein